MNEEQAFLTAIRDNPADATARLVFADWLEEHNDPRGEWLRLRTQLAQLPLGSPEFAPIKAREEELAPAALTEWMAIDGPVWCLLGGGLPNPPIPDWLTERNVESWQGMIGFYAHFERPRWDFLDPMQQLVSSIARTEIAKLFRAGQSMTTFVVSTAEKHGLQPGDAALALYPGQQSPRFVLSYQPPDRPREDVTSCDDETALRVYLGKLLTRLWCETRGRLSPPGV
jgi:uncharacterized protein (TIGR02996 family)